MLSAKEILTHWFRQLYPNHELGDLADTAILTIVEQDIRYKRKQIQGLAPLAELQEDFYDPRIGRLTMMCPVCRDTYMHIQRAATLSCGDESGDAPYDGMDRAIREKPTQWRRPAVVVEIDGESCGHRFRLRLQSHKGEIFLFTEFLAKTGDWIPLSDCWSGPAEIEPEILAALFVEPEEEARGH
jgi:hypothetical protein